MINVLIVIATDIIGGPGKGIIQFMTTAKQYCDDLAYELCDFSVKGTPLEEYEFSRVALANGLKIRKIDQRCQFDVKMPFQIIRHLKEGAFTILQTHGYKANVLGMIVHKMTGIPWVAFAHGQTAENRKMRFYAWLDGFAMKHANLVVSVSNGLYEQQLKSAGIRQSIVRVVHNAIDMASVRATVSREQMRTSLSLPMDAFVIGVIGRLSPEKGQDIFLEAFAQSFRNNPLVCALLVGDGQERDRLIAQAKRLSINGRIHFLGYHNDMPNIYKALDLVVMPSRSEGLPNVLLEALAAGKAVIATDVGGVAEVLVDRENGLLLPPEDVHSLVAAMDKIYLDNELFLRIAGNAQKSVKVQFSPEARARKIYAVYRELIGEK